MKNSFATLSRQDAEKLIGNQTREELIATILKMDKDASVTDEAQIAEYGVPATKGELIETFWAIYNEINA